LSEHCIQSKQIEDLH